MNTVALLSTGFATLASVVLAATSAQAIPRTFVSGTGSGTACTRAAPCATFQAAHDATTTGGQVNCLDPGDFGSVAITKAITIDCTGTFGAGTGPATGDAVTVNAGGAVRLRNLS